MSTIDLMARAQAGDDRAFGQLTEPYRRELQVHCYRMLGSFQDAEDALQETLLAAWRGLGGFEERASLRTWLYRIATNRCLNARRSAGRRQAREWNVPGVEPPEPSRFGDVPWLEPFPDHLLGGAGIPADGTVVSDAVVARFAAAYEAADLDAVVALLTDDVFISMPPMPFEYLGRDAGSRFFGAILGSGRRFRLVPARANGQPALGAYVLGPDGLSHGAGLFVLTLAHDRICAATRFETTVFPFFGLPPSFPAE